MCSASASRLPTHCAPRLALKSSIPIFFLLVGNFLAAHDITVSEAFRQLTMQDVLPTFVLNSETVPRKTMSEPPSTETSAANPAPSAASSQSDERLMHAFSQGSAEAFTELFRRYKQPLFGFFCRRVADPHHAEELTQEAFLVVLRSANRYQPLALFRTYLYAIGFRILRAHRRKTAFRATFFGQRNFSLDPATRDATETGLWVRRAVEKLDPVDREIVMLREFEQLSYVEIAGLIEMPLNTVRSRLFRARMTLRDLLEPAKREDKKHP